MGGTASLLTAASLPLGSFFSSCSSDSGHPVNRHIQPNMDKAAGDSFREPIVKYRQASAGWQVTDAWMRCKGL